MAYYCLKVCGSAILFISYFWVCNHVEIRTITVMNSESVCRVDTTRVEFTISLRENWSLPFLALQVAAITCYLRPQLGASQQVRACKRHCVDSCLSIQPLLCVFFHSAEGDGVVDVRVQLVLLRDVAVQPVHLSGPGLCRLHAGLCGHAHRCTGWNNRT